MLAVSSLLLSVAGLLIGFLAIPAVICGHCALAAIKRSRGELQGRVSGLIGLCLGYVGVLLFVVGLATFGSLLGKAWKTADANAGLDGGASSFDLSSIPLPNLPEASPLQAFPKIKVLVGTVDFAAVNKGARVPPGSKMKLRVYVPQGDHQPHSLPCVLVAPAGTNMLVGTSLDGFDPEHAESDEALPYAQAGMVAIQYSLDGAKIADGDENIEGWKVAHQAFRAAGAGTVNGRNALEFVKQRLLMVDPNAIFCAGHSSAGTVSLLLGAYEPRLRGCIAYAPGTDLEERLKDIRQSIASRLIFPNLNGFFKFASPINQTERIHLQVFLFQAKDDSNVPYASAVRFAEKLKKTNSRGSFVSVEDGDHYESMITQGIPACIKWIKTINDASSKEAERP